MRWLRPVVVAVVATLLLVVVGCGDQTDRYCGALKDDRKVFAELTEDNDAAGLIEQVAELKHLAGAAPEDLTDEWQTFVSAVEGVADALHEAGLKPSDFKDGRAPAGLAADERKAIAAAADRLSSQQVLDAVDGIGQQARDVCKIDIGM